MARKSTYEELGETVKELKEKNLKRKDGRKDMQESREMFEDLFATMVQGVVYQAGDGQIFLANPAAERILGLTLAQMKGRSSIDPRWRSVREDKSDFSGETHPSIVALKTGKPVNDVVMGVFNPQKEEYRWIVINAVPQFKPGESKPFQVFTTFTDITDHKLAEEAFQESEARYRTIFESTDEGYFEVDLKGNFTFVNDSMCKIRGSSRSELIGMNNRQYMDQKTSKRVYRNFNKIFKTGKPAKGVEWESIRKYGIKRYVESSISLLKDSKGNPIGFRGIVRDVTDRKIAEEALRKSEEKYRELFEKGTDLLCFHDLEGNLIHTNLAFKKEYGWEEKDLANMNIRDLIPERYRDQFKDYLKSVIEKGKDEGLMRGVTRDGRELILEYSNSLISDETGPIGVHGSARDVTEKMKTEEALRKSEVKYLQLFNTVPAGIILYDAETKKMIAGNDAAFDLYGYSREEFLNLTYWDITAEPEKTKETIPQILSGEVKRIPLRYQKKKDGTVIPVEASVGVFRLNNREMVCGVSTDISKYRQAQEEVERINQELRDEIKNRKQAEESLRRSEEQLRLLVETAKDMMVKFDNNGELIFVSLSYCDTFDKTEEELLGKNYLSFTHKDDREAAAKVLDRVSIPPHTVYVEKRAMTKNGYRWQGWLNTAVLDQKKKVVSIVAEGRDIHDQKMAEKALNEKTHELGERVKGLNCLYDMSRLVENPGISFEETLQGTIDLIAGSWQYPEVTCARLTVEAEEFTTPNFQKTEWRQTSDVVVDDRRIGILEVCYAEPKPEADEGPFLKGERDLIEHIAERLGRIIKQKKMKEERELLVTQLQHAQKMEAIGTLAGGIAHDFNNILASMIGYTQINLDDARKGTLFHQNLKHTLKAGYRAKDLIKQIIAFSRIDEENRKPLMIGPVVREILKLLKATLPSTIEIRQYIKVDSEIIEAESTQIHQLLMNLCTNAAYAMGENGGVLKVSLTNVNLDAAFAARHTDIEPGLFVKLSISDTGGGIPPKILDRIFDPYFTTKDKGHGTGLGLAVVHGVVIKYKGTIIVESTLGKGTTFNVYFPVTAKEVLKETLDGMALTGEECILLIDDEQPVVDIGKLMIGRLGYQVIPQTDAKEALELFKAEPDRFDLVITDMTMPHMTGTRLSKELMKIRPDIPIVLCTGYSEFISEEKAKEMGIRAFFMKPFIRNEIARTIREVLDGN